MTCLNRIKYFLLIIFTIPIYSHAGELKDFEWYSSSSIAAASGVDYTFKYTLTTGSPDFIMYLYAPQNSIDTSAIGNNPMDTNKIQVTIDGVDADVTPGGTSSNRGYLLLVKLVTPELAKAGSKVVITLKDVINGNMPGTYNWKWIRTSNGAGWEIDAAINPLPIKLTEHESPQKIQNAQNKLCLMPDTSPAIAGTNLITSECTDSLESNWYIYESGEVVHQSSGLCLDTKGLLGESRNNSILNECDSNSDQLWSLTSEGLLENTNGYCLELDSYKSNAMIYICNDSPQQVWPTYADGSTQRILEATTHIAPTRKTVKWESSGGRHYLSNDNKTFDINVTSESEM